MNLNHQPSKQTLDWLIRPLTQSGGFRQLIAACGGRHPIEILTALRTLGCDDGTLASKAARLAQEAELAEPARIAAQGDGLPLPHPLDFEWRFTDAAADELIDQCVSVTRPGASIALLGVPSVVLAALRSGHDRVFHVLTEANAVGAALEGLVRADRRFRFGGCARSAGAAIVDPPWYPTPLSDLLALTVAQCREGARVLVSAPPLGLRTGSVGERTQLLRVARSLGLDLLDQQEAGLRYRSPAFELAALKAAGVGHWLPDWRTGDLMTFGVDGSALPAPRTTPAGAAFELTVGGIRIRLQSQRPTGAGNVLRAVQEGEVLPSVSARDARRLEGNLWTSGNRVFSVDPKLGLKAMITLAEGRNLWRKGLDSTEIELGNLGSIDAVERLIHELDNVVIRESEQMAQLVGEAAWAKSVSDARFLNGSADVFLASLHGARG